MRLNHNRIRKLGSAGGSISLTKDNDSMKNGTSPSKGTTGGFGLSGLQNLEILQLGYNHVTGKCSKKLKKKIFVKIIFIRSFLF